MKFGGSISKLQPRACVIIQRLKRPLACDDSVAMQWDGLENDIYSLTWRNRNIDVAYFPECVAQ